jgi:hypothetical protein
LIHNRRLGGGAQVGEDGLTGSDLGLSAAWEGAECVFIEGAGDGEVKEEVCGGGGEEGGEEEDLGQHGHGCCVMCVRA